MVVLACPFRLVRPFWKKFTVRAVMPLPVMRRCIQWEPFYATDRTHKKQQYLPSIADGSLRLQAFGVTEPTSGTDTTALRTTARRDGDDYVVNGQKVWTSRAEYSDLMLLLARTTPLDQCAKKTGRIVGCFWLICAKSAANH